jgi:hypothetical protein
MREGFFTPHVHHMTRIASSLARRAALAIIIAGCASTATQRAYVAPTNETITTTTDQGIGDTRSHVIYVVNASTVPVIVFGVGLRNCENVKQQCNARTANIRVAAGTRSVVMRVEPDNQQRGFTYNFNYSWRADSSARTASLKALAEAGDTAAGRRLAQIARQDSIRRLDKGYQELTPDGFVALRDKAASMRAVPESLVLAPGERASLDRIQIVLVDKQGLILGRTRMLNSRWPGQGAVQLTPDGLLGVRPGRASVHYSLADQAQALIATPINEVEVPIIVAFKVDPHAPVFSGVAMDDETKKPLSCVRVALEDSERMMVQRVRADATGKFEMRAPRPGTYRLRVDLDGWSPAYGADIVANADESKTGEFPVRITERLTAFRPRFEDMGNERATIAGAASPPIRAGAPPGQTMRLSGSATMPIIDIVSRAWVGTTWAQFAVDDAGKLDTTTVAVPGEMNQLARAAIMRTLPQLRFSPAKESGKAVCDLMRIHLNFTPR